MRIAATGFVEAGAGSIAGANALLLQELVSAGCRVRFFSKARFVDPRPAVGGAEGLEFFDTDNVAVDRLRSATSRIPVLRSLTLAADVASYNALLVRRLAKEAGESDVCFWMGDYARGRAPGLPTVSLVQGPPGTDARSVLARANEIRELAGPLAAWKWAWLARLRLSKIGLPKFHLSDHFIVGSRQSKDSLVRMFGQQPGSISSIPYALDFSMFGNPRPVPGPLRVLWLGRIVPRKRLDIFLQGAELAFRRGASLRLKVVGGMGFIPGYEKLLETFSRAEKLEWIPRVARKEVPGLLASQDVLVQPSEEEDFGSSVAEAQAAGLPVVVGPSNGMKDYLCARDVRLESSAPEELAGHLVRWSEEKSRVGRIEGAEVSRSHARKTYDPRRVAKAVREVLECVAKRALE